MDKTRNIFEGNVESWVAPTTPQTKLRFSTKQTKALERYSSALHYLLLTDSGESECYEEALQMKVKAEWELVMGDEIASLMENQMWDLVELPERKHALHNKWNLLPLDLCSVLCQQRIYYLE